MPSPAAAAAEPLRSPLRRLAAAAVWVIVIALILRFFSAAQVILLGTLAAASVACMLKPLADRVPGSRAVGALVAVAVFALAVLVLVGGMGWLLAKPIKEEFSRLPEIRDAVDATLKQWSGQLQLSPPIDSTAVLGYAGRWIGQSDGLAAGMGGVVVSIGIALAFIFIGSIYFLADPRDNLLNPVLPALPGPRQRQLRAALDELAPKLRWWLIGHFCSMVIVGVVSGIGYKVSGIKFALPLAVLAGVAELVPTIGPIVGGVIAVLVASTQGGGEVAGAVITWAVVQTVESYVIVPLIMRRAVRIPAVVTLFSVVLWGEVFGAAGLFLAIPLDLLAWSLFKHFVIGEETADGAESRTTAAAPLDAQAIDAETNLAEAHPT